MNDTHQPLKNIFTPRLWGCVAALFFGAHLLLALLSYRGLIWDGHSYFFNLLHTRNFFIFDEAIHHRRDYARILLEFPTLALLWAGIENKPLLMRVFSASLLLHPVIAAGACWLIARKHHRLDLLWFPLLAFASYGIIASLFAVSEHLFFISLSWPLLFLILLETQPRAIHFFAIYVIELLMIRSGELGVLILPVTILALIWRISRSVGQPRLKWLWTGALALAVYALIRYIFLLLHLPDTLHQHIATTMLKPGALLILSPEFFLPLVIAGGGTAILIADFAPGLRHFQPKLAIMATSAVFVCGFCSLTQTLYTPDQAYELRGVYAGLTALAQFATLAVLFSGKKLDGQFPGRELTMLLAAGLITQSAMQLKTTYQWMRYTTLVEAEVATKNGYVPYEQTAMNSDAFRNVMEPINLFWCSNTLSILLNRGNDIHTIIGNRDPAFNKPFDPAHPENYQIVTLAIPFQDALYTPAAASQTLNYAPFFAYETYKAAMGPAYTPTYNKALPAEAFKSEVTCGSAVHFLPGQRHARVSVNVANKSNLWWPNQTSLAWNQFRIILRPHLYDEKNNLLNWDVKTGVAALPYPLAPQHQATLVTDLDVDAFPKGNSVLTYDLVQENVDWFANRGGKTCSVLVTRF